jgi:error-prone DNA polymerase
VPIFQEQVMQIAMIAADFTPGEADQLRRAMAAWKRKGGLDPFRQRLIGRMVVKGYPLDFAQRIFSQIEGFGEYGFPESHAASFAKLVYVSCWLKCHEPACFLAAMLNAQPLGFYSPSQLVQDARRHQVQVRPVDVTASAWDCTLESADGPPGTQPAPGRSPQPAVRLGLCMVAQLSRAGAERLLQARRQGAFVSVEDLALRAALGKRDLDALAAADALAALAGHRRQQVWQAAALRPAPQLLRSAPIHEPGLLLAPMPEAQDIVDDYRTLGLSLRRHPLALLRPQLRRRGLLSAGELEALPGGRRVAAGGLVTVRQQPSTARGTVFLTLEDETGSVNIIVGRSLRQRERALWMHARLLAVWGTWQRSAETGRQPGYGAVRNLVAHRLQDLSPLIGELSSVSRDFH